MSRRIEDLRDDMAELAITFQEKMAEANIPVLIYSTLRTMDEQARLYRQGRPFSVIHAKAEELKERWARPDLARVLIQVGPQYGPKRTNAGPGESLHNYGVAFDGCPMRNGEPVWGDTETEDARLWALYGEIGKDLGLEWGGNWTSFPDKPHFQLPDVDWKELINGDAQNG